MLRSPRQAARPAGTLAPQAHSCRCVPPPPQGEAAAADFPDRVAQAAPSRTARLRRGWPPRTAPPPCCTARLLRQDDSVSAAGRRTERCVQAAAHGPLAETGCKWRAPWFRPWVPRAGQKEARSRLPPGPADPAARTSRPAPAWLLDVAASRPARRDTLRSRPRHGSSRGSAWRDPDVCLRLRPSLKVAFAVTENRQLGAKLVPTRHTIRQWCRAAPRVVHELPFSTIYPQPEAAKRPVRGDALCITVIVGAHKPRFSPFH